jgi:hypothetical protein
MVNSNHAPIQQLNFLCNRDVLFSVSLGLNVKIFSSAMASKD